MFRINQRMYDSRAFPNSDIYSETFFIHFKVFYAYTKVFNLNKLIPHPRVFNVSLVILKKD